jgi:hypothetical protein
MTIRVVGDQHGIEQRVSRVRRAIVAHARCQASADHTTCDPCGNDLRARGFT